VTAKVKNPKLSPNEKLLTLFSAVFLAALLVITFFRGSFHPFDLELNIWISQIRSSPLTFTAKGIAFAFDTQSLAILSVITAAFLFVKNRRAEGLLLLGAMGGEALLVSFMKTAVQSPRPLGGLVSASGFSFPSGHTAGSVVFCGVLAFFAWRYWASMRARISIGVGVVALSSVVDFSRVYLSVHWFSDVVGGVMLGLFWLFFAILVFDLLRGGGKFESDRYLLVALFLFVLAVVVTVFAVGFGLVG
jgi:undecaprenyl-diphosphatase